MTPWNTLAMRALMRWVYFNPGTRFTCESLRVRLYADGLPVPAEPRSWGQIIVDAKEAGLIHRLGALYSKSSRGFVTVWRAK